jgi:hypothetical protein
VDIVNFETKSLRLVFDMQQQLTTALKSLTGKQHRGLPDTFNVFQASHINRASEGYAFLRKSGRVDASKLLIRPAIEATIRLLAVRKQPDLLYRMAYTERLEDRKWMRGPAVKQGIDFDAEDKKKWDDFTKAYAAHFPDHPLVEEKLWLRDAAVVAGLGPWYDSHYRLYCQFTHAAFRAVVGDLNDLEPHDNRTMALCLLPALEAAESVNATVPLLEELRMRLSKLDEPST